MEASLLANDRPQSWRAQYTFLKVFYSNVFFACLSFSLFTPWVHEYLDHISASSATAFTILMANNVGEILGALIFGLISSRLATKTALLSSIAIGFVGCVLFLICNLASSNSIPTVWLLLCRLLQGVWTGGEQTIEMAYVSEVVADVDKLKVLSELGIASVAGFLFGPGVGMALNLIGIHFGAELSYFPGIIHALSILTIGYFTYLFFVELPMDCRLVGALDRPVQKPDSVGVGLALLLYFVTMTSFAVCEHISKPLMTHDYEVIVTSVTNSTEDTYEVLLIALAVSIVAYGFLHWADGKITDRVILHWAQILVAVGWFFTFDYEASILSYTSFILGVTIGSFAIPICKMALMSMFSKILGPNRAVLST